MVWWLWIVLGLVLLAVEMLTPGGFFSFFFGIAALIVGASTGLGIAGPPWMQWLLFSAISVAALAVFRRPLMRSLQMDGTAKPVDSLVGNPGVVLEDVPAGGVGKVEVRGAAWNARSAAAEPLVRGRRCTVERVEGLTLWVRPE
jgi:membrane protein implicated in regulation of membrane protease activity